MEINTVVISLDRLKELELAEKKINEPRSKTIITESSWGHYLKIDTVDECDAKLAYEIKRKQEEIDKLKEEINKLKEEKVKITIDYAKKMNYLDFLKWKKS